MKMLKTIKNIFTHLTLVDKCLILIMTVLLIQSGYSLFTNDDLSKEMNTIDVTIRASAAAIFGYFLSVNFVRKNEKPKQKEKQAAEDCPYAALPENKDEIQPPACNRQQVFIITAIGLISLLMLLILRNFIPATPQAASTVSQLRDFVSAGVGFLVSCGKNHTA